MSAGEVEPPLAPGQYMYVLRCVDSSLYAGYTADLPRRLASHAKGSASKYTRAKRPVRLVAYWAFASQTEAMRAEWGFKQLKRTEKLARVAACGASETKRIP